MGVPNHGDTQPHLSEPADHELPAFVVDALHPGDVFGGILEGHDAGPLAHGIG